jgi:hypothetical protein
VREDGIGAGTEDVGQVLASLLIDRNAEQPETRPARLLDRYARILDGVAPFIMVGVVGFAVGQDQQQPVRVRAVDEARRGVAQPPYGCSCPA